MKSASTVAAAAFFMLAWLARLAVSEATTNATKDLQKEETSWQNRPINNRPTGGSKGGWSSSRYGSNGYGTGGYGNSGYGNGGFGNSGYGNSGYGSGGYGNSGYGSGGYGNSGYGNIGFGNSEFGNSGFGSSGFGSSGYGNNGYGGYSNIGHGINTGGHTGWNNNLGNIKGYTDYNRDIYMSNYGGNDWRRGQGFQPGYGTSNYPQRNLWRGDHNFGQKGSYGNYQHLNDYGSGYGNQIYGSGYSGDNNGYSNFGGYPREQSGYLTGNRGHGIDETRRRGGSWPSERRQGNFKGSYGGLPQGRQHRNVGNKGSAFTSRNFALQSSRW